MSHSERFPTGYIRTLDAQIIEFFENTAAHERFTVQELTQALDDQYPREIIHTRCLALVEAGRLTQKLVSNHVVGYAKGPFTHYRHITPLFAGNPEHLVCHRDGRVLAWCPDKLTAKLIRNALNGN